MRYKARSTVNLPDWDCNDALFESLRGIVISLQPVTVGAMSTHLLTTDDGPLAEQLRDSVAAYCARALPLPRLRNRQPAFERKVWREIADFGWLGSAFPRHTGVSVLVAPKLRQYVANWSGWSPPNLY